MHEYISSGYFRRQRYPQITVNFIIPQSDGFYNFDENSEAIIGQKTDIITDLRYVLIKKKIMINL